MLADGCRRSDAASDAEAQSITFSVSMQLASPRGHVLSDTKLAALY